MMGNMFKRLAFTSLLLTLAFTPIAHHAQADTLKPLIVMSAFNPFNGEDSNLSQVIAEELIRQHPSQAPYDLKFCLLNTAYDKSTQQLLECLKNDPRKPALVISLGEGVSCTTLLVETTTKNRDSNFTPDNEHVVHVGKKIIRNAPRKLMIPFSELSFLQNLVQSSTQSAEGGSRLYFSNNAGDFVCNNLAYRMTHYTLTLPKQDQFLFGFIHTPPHDCPNPALSTSLSVSALQNILNRFIVQ